MARRSSAYAWLVVVLLGAVWLLNYLDRQVIFSIFPLLADELHVTDLQLGLIGTAFLWIYAACSPWAGYFADRFGPKRLICGSLLVWSSITMLSGHVHNFSQLLVLRGAMGISEACYLPAGLALIAAYHGHRTRSRAVSLHHSGTYIGTVLGGVLGGWIGAHYGWRSVFAIFGGIGCAYSTLLVFVLREPREFVSSPASLEDSSERTATKTGAPRLSLLASSQTILRSPGFTKILAVFALASIADWAIYTWMPLYLFQSFHFTLAKAGFAATFYIKAGGFIGLLFGGLLADYWAQRSQRGRILTQTVGLACAAPCLILCGVLHQPVLLYCSMAAFGIGKGMYDGNTMPVLCQGVPVNLRATAYGILNFAGTLCGGAIAAAGGALKAWIGLSGVFLLCGALLCVAAITIASLSELSWQPET